MFVNFKDILTFYKIVRIIKSSSFFDNLQPKMAFCASELISIETLLNISNVQSNLRQSLQDEVSIKRILK